MPMAGEYFPSWNMMILADVLLTLIAAIASFMVYRYRADIRRAGAGVGVGCVLAGLWVMTAFYICDFYTMTVMPDYAGMDAAMRAMATLHLTYSWYAYSMSAVLVFCGLVLTVLQYSRQFREMQGRTEELLENENILDSIFENLPVGLLIKDSNHVRTGLTCRGTAWNCSRWSATASITSKASSRKTTRSS